MKIFAVSALLISLCMNAFAAEGKWIEGYGQGNLEYFIDAKGVRLYISCPMQGNGFDSYSGVSLYFQDNSKHIEKFTVQVNGFTYEGPFETDSRVGVNNFLSLLENLRKADAVVKFGKTSVKFPKSNAGKVIPVFGKNFSCNLS